MSKHTYPHNITIPKLIICTIVIWCYAACVAMAQTREQLSDSVYKYSDIFEYYDDYIGHGTEDSLAQKVHFFQRQIDAIDKKQAESEIGRNQIVLREYLEKKYNIKLP